MLTIQHNLQGHCATICPIADGYLIAYYLFPECSDTQKVQLRYITTKNEYKVIAQYTFYNKTGNCILIPDPTDKNKATIIYSYFNDTDGKRIPTRRVHRWMYCSNWIADIEIQTSTPWSPYKTPPWSDKPDFNMPINQKTTIQVNNIKPFPTQPTIGYLVRINPIKIHDQWLLPMYHEHPCYGQIMKSTDTKNWRTSGHIGLYTTESKPQNKLIQPSLWWDGEILHSLSRDMSGTGNAWHSSSADLGESWGKITPTNITNDNNSIAVINDNTNNPYIIWNEGERRHNLMLGKLEQNLSAKPIIKLNTMINASYPNYYIDNDIIHIVHTEYLQITHHIIHKRELNYNQIKQERIIIDEELQTRKPDEEFF